MTWYGRRMRLKGKTGLGKRRKAKRQVNERQRYKVLLQGFGYPNREWVVAIGLGFQKSSMVLAARFRLDALQGGWFAGVTSLGWFGFFFCFATGTGGQQHRRPRLSLPMTAMGEDRDADVRQQNQCGKMICENAVQHDGRTAKVGKELCRSSLEVKFVYC